jgi:hypothetical protein
MTLPIYTPDTLRGILSRHGLTGAQTGRLLGVDSRTIRKWTAATDGANHRAMPASAWWLLLLLTDELSLDALRRARQSAAPGEPETSPSTS